MNPNARASELIEATESLVTIIEQENEMLRNARVEEIEPLVQTKNTLVGMYEFQLKDAAQHKEFLDEIDDEIRTKLTESNARFQAAVRSNVIALQAAMSLNHQIVETIARAVQDQIVTPSGYGPNGVASAAPTDKSKLAAKMPITLNKEF